MFNGKTNGSLSKRILANGRTAWQIAIACGYKEVEKRGKKQRKRDFIYRTVHVPKNEAKRIMREMQNEIEANNGCLTSSVCKTTLREWNERWLRDFTQHIEDSTRSGYRTNLEYVGRSALAKTPLSQLSTFSFQEFFNSLLNSSTKGTNRPLIVNLLVERKEVSPKTQKTDDLIKQVAFYLDPLNDYLNNLTTQERKDLRGYFGGGADNRFWRAFQREISKVRTDFNPEGLQKFWEDETKTFNADSLTYLREIEIWTKKVIQEALANKYGANWEIKGLPKQIYKRAKGESDERNYDNIAADGDSAATISVWDCVTLRECKEIVTVGGHWTELFETLLTRPEDRKISGGKAAKTKWIESIESLQNKLGKPSYSVTTAEFEFVKSVYLWTTSM